MTLTIRKLNARCRSPRGVKHPGEMVDEVARGPFASELSGHLGPSLDRLPAVIRIKDLRLRVKIPSRNLNTMTLARAWARAFTIAIHRALAYPAGDGVISSRLYQTEAAYLGAMIRDIATRGLAPSWEFPEIHHMPGVSPQQAVLELLVGDLGRTRDIFVELERQGWLESILAFCDELSLERIMQAIAADCIAPALSLDDLIELGYTAAAPAGLHPQWPVTARRQAVRLWVRTDFRIPLRGVWHGLRLLVKFLEIPALLILGDPGLLADSIPFPPWCEHVVTQSATSGHLRRNQSVATGSEPIGPSLSRVLEALRPFVPSAAAPIPAPGTAATINWIVSDCAGILLMLPIIKRLDLLRLARKPELIRFGGLRGFCYLLAGIGMSLLKKWSPSDPVEPAVAIFAGMLRDPDLAGLRQFFSLTDAAVAAEIVPVQTWAEALDGLAAEVSRGFASLVRGFRKASREAVLKQFIRIRGRILVEDARVLVVLEPTPFGAALHLSGMDDPIENLEWLGPRRVEFVLEGL